MHTNKCWREHSKLYSELAKVTADLPSPLIKEVHDKCTPLLFQLLKDGAEPVKKEGALFLATLIYYLPNQERKKKCIDQMVEEFGESRCRNKRKIFIEFCARSLAITS